MGLWVTLKFDTHELLTYTLGTKLWQFSTDSCCVTKYVVVRHSTLWENRPWLWYHEISVEILQLRWYHEIWEVCITLWHISREKRFQVYIYIYIYIYIYWFTGNDPANKETPNSTWANFKGFPGTHGLMSPPKDTKVNLLLNFWGRVECTRREINLCCKWDWNPGPFDPQSSALTNKPLSTPQVFPFLPVSKSKDRESCG